MTPDEYEILSAPQIIDNEVEIVAQKWLDHDLPHNAFAFIEDMRAVLDKIPVPYRTSAEIDIRSWHDRDGCPDHSFVVSYKRPPTERELMLSNAKASYEVFRDRNWLQQRIAALVEEAAYANVPLGDLGLSLEDGFYRLKINDGGDANG